VLGNFVRTGDFPHHAPKLESQSAPGKSSEPVNPVFFPPPPSGQKFPRRGTGHSCQFFRIDHPLPESLTPIPPVVFRADAGG